MELRHLRAFLAVAEARHFGRAGRALGLSQPAVSQQIKLLEDELGDSLLDRGERGVSLTPAGERFRAYASRALEEVRAGERAVHELRGGAGGGTLRVGFVPSLAGSVVVPAIAAVRRRFPELTVHAFEGLARDVEKRLAEGRLDVGLAFAPARDAEVEAEPILERRLALVVPPRHRLAHTRRVRVDAIAGEPFALLAPHMRIRAQIDAYLASVRIVPRVVLEVNAVGTLVAAVRAGVGVTLLPGVPGIDLAPAPQSSFVSLLWLRRGARTAAAMAFAEEIRRG